MLLLIFSDYLVEGILNPTLLFSKSDKSPIHASERLIRFLTCWMTISLLYT